MASNYVLSQSYIPDSTNAITLDDVKTYGNINISSKDTLLNYLITASHNAFTNYTNAILYKAPVKASLSVNTSQPILLPYPHPDGITSLKDKDGKDVVYSLFGSWLQPATQGNMIVEYKAGLYDPMDTIDEQIIVGLLKYVISNYDDTQNVADRHVYRMPNDSKSQWERYKFEYI